MTKTPSIPPSPAPDAPRDWFLPAIEADGSVSDCLGAVLDELERRAGFIKALRKQLNGSKPGADSVTELGQRIRTLENTLRFRLGMLSPDRPAAWFRAPAATSAGPFTRSLIDEPVFAPYEVEDLERMRDSLQRAWASRLEGPLTFRDDSPCLWRTLLSLWTELGRVVTLPAPFATLSLETLPEDLPSILESRALRAFLLNVRGEILQIRDRLEGCYRQLLASSEKLWAYQLEALRLRNETRSSNPHKEANRGPHAYTAGQVRAEFRRRRQEARPYLTHADLEALRFMGFEDLPAQDLLRQRYLDMAKRLHPDRMGGNDQSFKVLSSAYAHLCGRYEMRFS